MFGYHNLSRILASGVVLLSLVVLPRTVMAAPLQAGQPLEIPWWVWLVVISLFLLVTFIIFISLSWRDSADSAVDQNERK